MNSILIVDDREENLYSLSSLLSQYYKDLKIYTQTSGREALKFLLTKRVDLIILDIQMPDMDGFEVAKMLKKLDSTASIPIIFLTAVFKKREYQEIGFKLGGVDYLRKPIDDNQLLNKIDLYLRVFQKERAQEAMLIQQSKMASLGEMLSAITHQWRQPLNNLSLLISDIDSEKDDSYTKEFVKNAREQLSFLSEVIDEFKEFFNPSEELENFLLKDAIDSVISIMLAKTLSEMVDIELDIDRGFSIYGNITQLKQVILNLINNSIDAIVEYREVNSLDRMDYRGEILIKSISSKSLIIKDNGVGVDSLTKESIFEQFATTKGKGGSGIGLYISKIIIEENFRGELYLKESKRGSGATFQIDFF